MTEAARDAEGELTANLVAALGQACRTGYAGARKLLEHVRTSFLSAVEELHQQNDGVSRVEADRLRSCAEKLRRLAQPRGSFQKSVTRWRPDVSLRRLLSRRQRTQIERLLREADRIALRRHDGMVSTGGMQVIETMIGPDRESGWVQAQIQRIEAAQQAIAGLRESASTGHQAIVPESSTTLHVVEDVQQFIDAESGRTFLDLALDQFRRAGAAPEDFAMHVLAEGIEIDGRQRRVDEWARLNPVAVVSGLTRALDQYLGIGDEDIHVDPDNPHTAVDYYAQLDLLHEELRPRTVELIPTLVQRSSPYLELPLIGTNVPQVQRLLHVSMHQRAEFVALLGNHVTISEPEATEAYHVTSRYVVVLEQELIAGPLGASKAVQRWRSVSNEAKRKGSVEPIHDVEQSGEFRFLRRRVKDRRDCGKIVEGALKAESIYAVNPEKTRFAPVRLDSRRERVFAPANATARWQPGREFVRLCAQSQFVRLLQQLHPEISDITRLCAKLGRESDPQVVVTKLVAKGILEEECGQYRMARCPARTAGSVPPQLYEFEQGAMVGLTRDEFVSRLLEDDLLYSHMFFAVLDAFDLGYVTANDVPHSVIAYHNWLHDAGFGEPDVA